MLWWDASSWSCFYLFVINNDKWGPAAVSTNSAHYYFFETSLGHQRIQMKTLSEGKCNITYSQSRFLRWWCRITKTAQWMNYRSVHIIILFNYCMSFSCEALGPSNCALSCMRGAIHINLLFSLLCYRSWFVCNNYVWRKTKTKRQYWCRPHEPNYRCLN